MKNVSYRLISLAVLALACASIGADGCGFGNPFDKSAWSGVTTSGAGASDVCGMAQGQGGGYGGGPGAGGADVGGSVADVGVGVGGGGPDPTPQGVCGGLTVDQQAALAALAGVDLTKVEINEQEAEYAIYLIESMIQQNVADPASAGDAMLQTMAEQVASSAAAAEQWAQGLDPATVPLFTPDPDKMATCMEKFGCRDVEACPFSKSCWLVNCGDANCPACPATFQPNKLLFTGWCAHVCLGPGSPPGVVGYKVMIHFRGGVTWPFCYQPANDH